MKTEINYFAFDADELGAKAAKLHDAYCQNEPFPHISIDHFLPEWVAEGVLEEFTRHEEQAWEHYKHKDSQKLAITDEARLGPFTRHVVAQLNSSVFLQFLEQLTGIQGLIPDPYLWGGGLHCIRPGGYLNMHVDFNKHTKLNLDRRLNLLIYLNKDWKEEYGGHLELWNKDMSARVQKILPVFNRMAMFNTSEISYHGLPHPLTCPEGQSRKSLALYYYTAGRDDGHEAGVHSTIYRNVPGQKDRAGKDHSAGSFWKNWLPPALYNRFRKN